ncbi:MULTISPECIES: AAA family ATPase [unclassified Acinetobacter]|uniref:AAA family ATPase n=1 Tax=unclassified Acinetobacter TaxID=196816 RepID=UPI002935104E|nr:MULTISPECIES: AAA family ATPase [unclassified Acinetobacter]WOE32978.1 AAA family ATPase [Acinetobacter sp. SAAs470]WOE38456.1 AAA family ATPase [Acinetobacter sp. SAAs474]
MKIISIRLKNLASLAGEHFIDFSSEPLASAGLIAIVGQTGAGKSTILDAMCLALFNRIPRLKESDGKLIDVDGTELLTNSPLTILRRGTAHGFAELSFVAQNQKVYLARWEIKRARENPNGKLQNIQRSLKCLTDGQVLADKKTAVDQQIQQITQLSFEQFTRAVLLAQSEVTAFLKARDHERGELLQYLTNSDIFEKVGQLAYEKTKKIASQRKELENVLGHIEILAPEKASELSRQLQQQQHQYQDLQQKKRNYEKQYQWFEQQQQIVQDLQQRQQQLQIQQQCFAQLHTERQTIKQLDTFATIRANVLQAKKMSHEIDQLTPKIAIATQQFAQIQQQFNTQRIQFEKIDQQLQAQQQFEQQYQPQLAQISARIQERDFILQQLSAAKLQAIELDKKQQPLLHNHMQLQQQCQQLEQQLQQQLQQLQPSEQFHPLDHSLHLHLTQLERFIASYQKFEQQFGDFKQALNTLQQQQQQLQTLQQQFGQDDLISQHIELKRQQRETNIETIHQLRLWEKQYQYYSQIQQEQQQRQNNVVQITQEIEKNQQKQQNFAQQYQNQKQHREQLQQILIQQQLLHSSNIEKLRQQLVDGTACLVCGSTTHPYRIDQTSLSTELLHLQQQQEQDAIAKEQQYFTDWQTVQQNIHQQQADLTANHQRLAECTERIQPLQQALQSSLQQLELNVDLTQDKALILDKILDEIKILQHDNQALEIVLNQLTQAQKQQRQLDMAIQQLLQQLAMVEQAQQNIQAILELLNTEQQQEWQAQPLNIAQQLQQQLQQRLQLCQEHQSLTQQRDQHIHQLTQLEQHLALAQEQIKLIELKKTEYTQKGKDNSRIAIELIVKISQQSVEKPHEWLQQFEQQRQQLQQQFHQQRKSYDQIRQSFEQQQRQLDQLQTQLTQCHHHQITYTNEIKRWLDEHSDFDLDLIEKLCLISGDTEQNMRDKVKQLELALRDAQSALNTIEAQYQQHRQDQPQIAFEQLQLELDQLNATQQQLQEQRDQLKLQLDIHHNNVKKQQQFLQQIEEIQSEEHRWNKISSLMGDATGKKFRDYAQQYHLDMLIEYANQQLNMLSQRYTLKRLDQSLSLAIVDHDMDGETRSVASLSGGESFLTALALSLAIANMASGAMKIESLFIDEGFGTLDAASLHLVMNALDQLQNQGRKVILISHIQEMHERIPVQIQVKSIGAGASTIQLVGA